MNKIPVVNVIGIESGLYPVQGEDQEYHCFDTLIVVVAGNGKKYCKNDSVPGAMQDGEGFFHPNRNYKFDVAELIRVVRDQVGDFFDPEDNSHHVDGLCDQWYEVPDAPTYEDNCREDAERHAMGTLDREFDLF